MTTKAALYARAGIPEYWVLDVSRRRLIVHREPGTGTAFGKYVSIMNYADHEAVAPLAAPQANFLVRDAFPQRDPHADTAGRPA